MTISSGANKVNYAGNGATAIFAYSFQILQATDLQVIYTDATGVQTTLASGLYTVSGIGSPTGGTVTYPLSGSPIANGTSLTLLRQVQYLQQTSLVNQTGYYPQVVEQALDLLTMQTQQLSTQQGRAILIPAADPTNIVTTLPAAGVRANLGLVFDASGNVTAGALPSTAVSAAMIPIISAATVAVAQALLLSEWLPYTPTATLVNATQFTVTGDQTAIFTVNRRIKATVTPGPIYGLITGLLFAAGVTTVTVLWDSGALDSGLSAVFVGLLSVTNPSIPVLQQMPVGALMPYAGSAAPSPAWLLCGGQAVSRTTYSTLFAVIGTTYGVGDGGFTFNVPDLRGRAIHGKDDMGGAAANRVTNAISGIVGTTLGAVGGDERLHLHNHAVTDPQHSHSQDPITLRDNSGSGNFVGGGPTRCVEGGTTAAASTGITIQNTGAGGSQNMPPTLIANWLIRALN